MHGNKTNIKHVGVFKITCYALRYRENLDMFEAKSDLGIFLRYLNNNRAYRVYNLRTSIVLESINMAIDDSSATIMVEFDDSVSL